MVVNLVNFVLRAKLFAFFGGIVSTVIEAVATPLCASKLRPFYVVGQQFARCNVLHVYFLPVATAARDNVSHVFSIFREACALQRNSAVVAQFVRIEELTERSSQLVHLVKNALIL